MRRFQLTSDKFTGTADLLYNDAGLLCKIDCTQSNMTAEVINTFKRAVPVHVDAIVKGEGFTAGTVIVEASIEVSFEMLWDKYQKKINRKRAMQVWHHLSKTDQVKAYYHIDEYFKYLKAESWRTKLDPENYLRNRTWENEYK